MGVDILRAIEVKDKNGKWKQLKYYKGKAPKLTWWQKFSNLTKSAYNNTIRKVVNGKYLWGYQEPDGGPWDNIYCSNKDIWADYLEDNGHRGLPKDADPDSLKLYEDYGCAFYWATLQELENAAYAYKKEFLCTIKNLGCYTKLNEILDLLNKVKKPSKDAQKEGEEPYYPMYDWDDLEINDEFDDKFACMLWHYEMLVKEVEMARFIFENFESIFNYDDVRIIFIYNN